MIGIFDIYKIGLGPSSSHTMAPMTAARSFLDALEAEGCFEAVAAVRVELFGSLAFTGKGHATDTAILLGLGGETPEEVDVDAVPDMIARIRRTKRLRLAGRREIGFDEARDLIFDTGSNPFDFSSAMRFSALDAAGRALFDRGYLSLGGGFVAPAGGPSDAGPDIADGGASDVAVPYPFTTGAALLEIGRRTGLSIDGIALANERARHDAGYVEARLRQVWRTMRDAVGRAVGRDGPLPGPLALPRRAPDLHRALMRNDGPAADDPLVVLDWVNLFAIAVNEENASGGRVVTAPTNGAAGVVPAVGLYYERFVPGADEAGVFRLLAAAAAIATIYKTNASFAASEVGCQGEVGVACSMAAAGLAAAMGGSNEQVEMAAEIGMEHNLGLTCDPIGGYVQVPCIERNALGAVKAIDAARLALRSDGRHAVSLDAVIKTMWETGRDMQSKYKDTGAGGLAVNVPLC